MWLGGLTWWEQLKKVLGFDLDDDAQRRHNDAFVLRKAGVKSPPKAAGEGRPTLYLSAIGIVTGGSLIVSSFVPIDGHRGGLDALVAGVAIAAIAVPLFRRAHRATPFFAPWRTAWRVANEVDSPDMLLVIGMTVVLTLMVLGFVAAWIAFMIEILA